MSRISHPSTKEKVLMFLERSRGQSISGAQIAQELELSRNTVWKAIHELKGDGHTISAVTNRGYCLHEDSDVLSQQGIAHFLQDKGLAQHISVYSSLDSTNILAKEAAVAGACHGTSVIADAQLAGRGRYGRSFFSPAGTGLYLSMVLCPDRLKLDDTALITAFAALSVCEALEELVGIDARIKWVNDIFVEGRKVCGISTEAAMDFESRTMQWVVVGIGINFKDPKGGFPEDERNRIASIFARGKASITRNHLAAEIIQRIADPKSASLDKENFDDVMLQQYKKRLFMLGERVLVTEAHDQYEAIACDIDNKGQLIITKDDGETRTLASGEVSIRPQA